MAEKILNTRLQLKIDTFANWSLSNATTQANKTNGDFVLKHGEIGLCEIKGNDSIQTVDPNGLSKTQVLFKVGDGTTPFKNLQWASALAADVYTWAKENKITINKVGTGNVVSGIEWDATANGGKGGIKFTTAAVATAEGLGELQGDVSDLEKEVYGEGGTKDNSRIDKLEKDIADNREVWAKDDNTTYTFAKTTDGKGITITPSTGNGTTISFAFLTQAEIKALNYLVAADITTGSANGTIAVEGTDVKVKGLQDAAYTTVSALNETAKGYADSKDEAIQAAHKAGTDAAEALDNYKTEMTTTILPTKADKSVVDAMYTNAKIDELLATKDEQGAAAAVLGNSNDGASANTVYGAKAAAAAAQSDATIAKTKIETFLGTVTPDGSDAIIDTLTEINSYVGEHGEEFAALSGRVTNIEKGTTVVPKAEDANTLDGHDSDYFATSAENGAKALAEAALPKATAEADYLKKADAADTYATKSEATYAAGDNIDITNNTISLKDKLVGVTSIKGSQGLAGISIDDDGHISVNDAYGFNVYADSAYFNCGVQVKDKVRAAEVETQDLIVNGDVTVGGKDLFEVIKTIPVDEATKATQDGNGKNIADTYATKSEATYTGSNNISVQGKQIKLSTGLTGLNSIIGNQFLSVTAQEGVSIGSEYCTLDVGHEDIKIQSTAGSGTGATIDLFGTGELNITAKDVNINGKAVHAIATSGNVNDLEQTAGDVLVFNCGTSTTVI